MRTNEILKPVAEITLAATHTAETIPTPGQSFQINELETLGQHLPVQATNSLRHSSSSTFSALDGRLTPKIQKSCVKSVQGGEVFELSK